MDNPAGEDDILPGIEQLAAAMEHEPPAVAAAQQAHPAMQPLLPGAGLLGPAYGLAAALAAQAAQAAAAPGLMLPAAGMPMGAAAGGMFPQLYMPWQQQQLAAAAAPVAPDQRARALLDSWFDASDDRKKQIFGELMDLVDTIGSDPDLLALQLPSCYHQAWPHWGSEPQPRAFLGPHKPAAGYKVNLSGDQSCSGKVKDYRTTPPDAAAGQQLPQLTLGRWTIGGSRPEGKLESRGELRSSVKRWAGPAAGSCGKQAMPDRGCNAS
jgi:hypothetical protein